MTTSDTCFLCGRAGADSAEHIVPRCFFDYGIPDRQCPTERAHATCNKSTAADEQYLFVRLASSRTVRADGEEQFQRAKRSLLRDEARRFAQNFANDMTPLPGGAGLISIERERALRVFAKVVKGLVYRERKDLLIGGVWGYAHITLATMVEAPAESQLEVPGVLNAKWCSLPDDDGVLGCWLSIYGEHFFCVMHVPEHVREPFASKSTGDGWWPLTWPLPRAQRRRSDSAG